MVNNTKIKAVLFDCDGVLLDSVMPLKIKINEWLCEEVEGFNLTSDCLMNILRGKNIKQVVETLQDKNINIDSSFEDKIITYVKAEYPTYTKKINNVDEMLENLNHIPKVICSNGMAEVFEQAINLKKLDNHFKGYFGRDNTGFSKPNPGVYIAGAEFLNLPLKNCLIVEDSPTSGMSAAKASKAGVIVGFTGSGTLSDDLINAGADYIINDLNELPILINKINNSI